jgi:hypothetical protein
MASARKTTLRTKYKVRGDADVQITVVFGDGQKGSSSILGPPSRIGELTRWPLGTGAELRGKTIDVRSTVSDVNAKTNHVSATYIIEGGDEPLELHLESTVAREGATERFHVVVEFT